ncbi:Fe-S cluster assembly ATPase SufC [Candidatus Similichlamydia laticola]|uniref:Iron-sulfur cluster assembly ATPase protein SufC n=1 Tax=Candidatus Similichlamydia laticola TaxID=2170265 RepID=A0A369KB75_9BACT|nr:Fe-S cluster assembly ATPase SufC [Candidatus Similichlamydia laticola]RDB31859.1 Iron-sulfur cluster assembly ATPase protein SufC [Candidatus Similichlamydia laticola]
MLLTIQGLRVQIGEKPILHEIDLEIAPGEIHVIMGPNGAGKSSLARTLAGHPSCVVTSGRLIWNGSVSLLDLPPEERAHLGLFVSFQNPPEIPGVCLRDFLQQAYSSMREKRELEELSEELLAEQILRHMSDLGLPSCFLDRCLNEGFSGGEKKRCEILQMVTLSPRLAVLDEMDSGLDLDALSSVVDLIRSFQKRDFSALIITHYPKLVQLLEPTSVHLLCDGRIVRSGKADLATEIDRDGYRYVQTSTHVFPD